MLSRAPVLAVVTAVAAVQALTDRTRVPLVADGATGTGAHPRGGAVPASPLPSPQVHVPAGTATARAAALSAARAVRAAGTIGVGGAGTRRRGRPRSAATLAGLVGVPALALALPAGLPLSGPSGLATASVAAPLVASTSTGDSGTGAPAGRTSARTSTPTGDVVTGPGPDTATVAALRERVLAERAAAAEVASMRATRNARARGEAARRTAARAAAVAAATRPRVAAPVAAPVGSAFGIRWGRLHAGLDFPAPIGTPISAAADGVVEKAGPASGYGKLVTVRHADGTVTAYGHMRVIEVAPGQAVQAGQVIARVGNEGRSTGPHLHFEVRTPDGPLDPRPWLAERGVQV